MKHASFRRKLYRQSAAIVRDTWLLIREFGWHDTRVFDGDPEFSYTTGFLLR